MSFTAWSSRKAQSRANRSVERGYAPEMGWNVYIRLALGGARNGELQRRYHAYLASPQWQRTRARFLAVCGHACARCGTNKRLQVHHVHYRTVGEEGLADIRIVCRGCHQTDHAGMTDARVPMTPKQVAAWRAEREAKLAEPPAPKAVVVRRRPKVVT